LKVLYITEAFTPHDIRFADAILGHDVQLYYCTLKSFVIIPTSFWEQDKIQKFPTPTDDLCEWESLIKREGIDLIHIGPINELSLKIMKRKICPQIVMSWGSDILINCKQIDDKLLKDGLNRADGFFTDCEIVTDEIKKHLSKPIEFVKFPWGIEQDRFLSDKLEKEGKEIRDGLRWRNKKVIISTRSWEEHYNIENLIDSFMLLKQQSSDYKLILISSGSLKSKIMLKIKKNKLQNDIYCTGVLNEKSLAKWLHAADLYITTSKSDGSSISLLEAMMCKLPVIAHNQYGNLEWVSENENGWLANCNDPSSILDSFLKAEKNLNNWTKIGETNRSLIEKNASWSRNKLSIFKFYQKVLGKNRVKKQTSPNAYSENIVQEPK